MILTIDAHAHCKYLNVCELCSVHLWRFKPGLDSWWSENCTSAITIKIWSQKQFGLIYDGWSDFCSIEDSFNFKLPIVTLSFVPGKKKNQSGWVCQLPVASLALVLKLICKFHSTGGQCNPAGTSSQKPSRCYIVLKGSTEGNDEKLSIAGNLSWFWHTPPNPHSTILANGHFNKALIKLFHSLYWRRVHFQWSLWKRKVW